MAAKQKELKVGVVGYGPAFGMGKHHLSAMRDHAGFKPWAVCDLSKERLATARQEFPGVETYTDLGEMLRKSEVELVTVILPHNAHADAAIRCLNAKRHVVVEKPMACTLEECERMIAAARRSKRMLSVYHNRHWDSNILTIMKHLPKIGRPFRWESFAGGYRQPRAWWRSDRAVSGGTIFDWGAHFTEWMFQVMRYDIDTITGFGIKEVWKNCTTEDEVESIVRFKGGAIASYTESFVAAAGKPMIRICGTLGAIVADHRSVTVHTVEKDGTTIAATVPMEPAGHPAYYANIRDHLLDGKKLIITPELGMRIIQVLDFASRSARTGKTMKAKYA